MRRLPLAVTVAFALLAIAPSIAAAHTGTATVTCTSVTYTYDNASFGNGGTTQVQTILEQVFIDGSSIPAAETTVQINPLAGGTTTSSLAISVPTDGHSHTVTVDAFDETTGHEVQVGSLSSGQTSNNGYFPITQTITCAAASAPLTPGYWKNHEAATTALLPQSLGGYTVDTFAKAQAVFDAMNCGNSSSQNAFGCLAGHLLAAELNEANGAASPSCVTNAISEANALLSSGGYSGPTGTYSLTVAQRNAAISIAGTLDAFNNGSPTC
jgi:hypothetical protein